MASPEVSKPLATDVGWLERTLCSGAGQYSWACQQLRASRQQATISEARTTTAVATARTAVAAANVAESAARDAAAEVGADVPPSDQVLPDPQRDQGTPWLELLMQYAPHLAFGGLALGGLLFVATVIKDRQEA